MVSTAAAKSSVSSPAAVLPTVKPVAGVSVELVHYSASLKDYRM